MGKKNANIEERQRKKESDRERSKWIRKLKVKILACAHAWKTKKLFNYAISPKICLCLMQNSFLAILLATLISRKRVRARALLLVFEIFTRAYLFQIALEIMWLPILTVFLFCIFYLFRVLVPTYLVVVYTLNYRSLCAIATEYLRFLRFIFYSLEYVFLVFDILL